jgi:adenylate cyclase
MTGDRGFESTSLQRRVRNEPYDAANRAIRSSPNYPNPYRWLAAALGQLGRIDEAGQALEKAIAIAPAAFDLYVRERAPRRRPEDPRPHD